MHAPDWNEGPPLWLVLLAAGLAVVAITLLGGCALPGKTPRLLDFYKDVENVEWCHVETFDPPALGWYPCSDVFSR